MASSLFIKPFVYNIWCLLSLPFFLPLSVPPSLSLYFSLPSCPLSVFHSLLFIACLRNCPFPLTNLRTLLFWSASIVRCIYTFKLQYRKCKIALTCQQIHSLHFMRLHLAFTGRYKKCKKISRPTRVEKCIVSYFPNFCFLPDRPVPRGTKVSRACVQRGNIMKVLQRVNSDGWLKPFRIKHAVLFLYWVQLLYWNIFFLCIRIFHHSKSF